jgi:hypothetical protein
MDRKDLRGNCSSRGSLSTDRSKDVASFGAEILLDVVKDLENARLRTILHLTSSIRVNRALPPSRMFDSIRVVSGVQENLREL